MRCHPPKVVVALLCVAAALPGCAPQQPLYFRNNGDMSHYLGVAATLDNANITEPSNGDVANTMQPWSITRPGPKDADYWDLTLEEVVKEALNNGKVLRTIGGQVQGPPAFLTSNPAGAPTIYDPAIVESDARFGIAAGESLFDPTWTTDLFWERNHEPRNVNQNFAGSLPLELSQDAFQFQTGLTKIAANGAQLSFSSSTAYDMQRNDPTRQFPSDWQTSFKMEIRQPLLQGYGVEFNQIAGPGAIPGFNQGVLLARVNTDIALTSFEGAVRNMVGDVESAYWELYFAYRNLDAAVEGRDDALRTWQKANALYLNGPLEGSAAFEAQALEQYYGFRNAAEQAQSQLYDAERRLRFMMGIQATDGRLIRPKDDPATAKISFDWNDCLGEALARSVEIREARFRVKQRDLELIAAKNYLLPQLSLDASYRWTGLGHDLVSPGDPTLTGGAVDNLAAGQFQDWHIAIDASVPIGFRKQTSGVTNAEDTLARERVKLTETEKEVVSQLSFAVSGMDAAYMLTFSNFNRRAQAKRQVEAVQTAYDHSVAGVTFNDLLNAQQRLAQSESDYYRSLTNYAKAISLVHRVKGTLLEYNGVYLTEGPWPAQAYFDARRRARARAAATYIDYGFSYPRPVGKGPYQEFTGQPMSAEETPAAPPSQSPSPRPSGEQTNGLPEPSSNPSANPSAPGPEPLPAPMPGPAAPREAAKRDGTTAEIAPVQRSHDLGAMDLSGLAGKSPSPSVEPSRLDITGFAAPRPAVSSLSVRDAAVQPAGYQEK
jgi:outer membrane protein TolC